jgi:hypothetical protein
LSRLWARSKGASFSSPVSVGFGKIAPGTTALALFACGSYSSETRVPFNGALALNGFLLRFLNGGDEWVWNRLEAYYECRFEGAEYPNFDPIIEPHPDDRTKAA